VETATLNKYTILFTQDSFNFQRQNKSDLLNENEAMLFLVHAYFSKRYTAANGGTMACAYVYQIKDFFTLNQ
jgi:hypothetical protein